MPETHQAKGVIPNLTMAGRAREAIDLWTKAFGAEEIAAYEDNGRIRHFEHVGPGVATNVRSPPPGR